jgi:GPH family glycoside/pentoside/hexuronide:cation symporter
LWIRAWEIGLPPLLCLVSVLLLLKYPLTETRAYEVKALLRERKEMFPKSAPARATVS